MDSEIKEKQLQFNLAMKKYEEKKRYRVFSKIVSVIIIFFQAFLLFNALQNPIGLLWHPVLIIVSYILADFINGLVHIYMDNNENYLSSFGPFIASFHLHHKTPRYKRNPLWKVYFNESGSKIWLAAFLVLFSFFVFRYSPHNAAVYGVFYFSVFSSIAEVSHYLCHSDNKEWINLFRKTGILLGKHHHGKHHIRDNMNYAFLNGMTDPLLNPLANKYFPGYRNTTDKHYRLYRGKGTDNR